MHFQIIILFGLGIFLKTLRQLQDRCFILIGCRARGGGRMQGKISKSDMERIHENKTLTEEFFIFLLLIFITFSFSYTHRYFSLKGGENSFPSDVFFILKIVALVVLIVYLLIWNFFLMARIIRAFYQDFKRN